MFNISRLRDRLCRFGADDFPEETDTRLAAVLRLPAACFFQLGRRISLLVSDEPDAGEGRIVLGPYQSPILIQWQPATHSVRLLDVRIVRFT